ncbi:hypothetical protein [Rhizobium sp. OAE497]|uniref:hypothetical protein n=1 Tax=Rhizobium sp. OAE497 TaxID=2663796 RepID=UPI0018F6DDA2
MDEDDIVSLETSLGREIFKARAVIAAMPASIDLATETALIETASAEACRMARDILSQHGGSIRVFLKAEAWLDGTYPAETCQ